jgi:hypothetical protein
MYIPDFKALKRYEPLLQRIIPKTADGQIDQLIRDRNFTLLDASTRITCFADGEYVIKTLTPKEDALAMFGSWLSPKTLKDIDWAEDPTSDDVTYDIMAARSLVSYSETYVRAQQEAGMLAIHLCPTTVVRTPLAIDNEEHDANNIPFIVQYQAELVQDRLRRQLAKGQGGLAQAKESLNQILEFIVDLARKGISDESHRFHDSFGWNLTTGAPMITDIGELRFSYGDVYSQIARDSLHKPGYHDGRRWISQIHPDLGTFLLERTAELFTLKHIFG